MAAIIVFIVFGGFGVMMLGVGARQFVEQRRLLARARPVEAVVTRSEVFAGSGAGGRGSGGTSTFRPDVEFRYTVGGAEYASDRLYPTIIARTFASYDAAAAVLSPFPVGARVRAYVDEARPEQGFLIAEAGAGPVVFVLVGLIVPPIAWLVGRYLI